MALAPKLEFKQSQQLVMTPQLQQAIKLLQLSNIELAEFIEEQLEENPFLERDNEAGDRRDGERAGAEEAAATPSADDGIDLSSAQSAEQAVANLDADYDNIDPESAPSESAAADYQSNNDWANSGGGRMGDDDRSIDATHVPEKSLHDHLTEQLHIALRDPHELMIGAYLIDLIDDSGYLREPVEEVAERLGLSINDIEQSLRVIQSFDPCGVGARDLKECLCLQLQENNRLDPMMQAFMDHIELLAQGDLKGLINATGANEEEVRDMIGEVRALNPKPGYAFGGEAVQVVVPDVYVSQSSGGGWKVELNNDTLPRILVNQRYYTEVTKSASSANDQEFVSEHFSNANWLAKSLDQRARTILRVAREIVRQQDEFFVHGVRHLRPLNLKAVADAIEMHESTVSRVTANKYIATPRGLFEMKYFFTAAIASSAGGQAHSAEAVRHRIKELVEAEKPGAILSDDRIVEILRDQGIDIARRTVAKYRETLHIPSSVQRRRMAARAAI